MLLGLDQDVVGHHRAVHHARAVRHAERDQQPPPHPRGIAGIDPGRERGPDRGEAHEPAERVEDVDRPVHARALVAVGERVADPRHVRAKPLRDAATYVAQRRRLPPKQVVVRGPPGHLEQGGSAVRPGLAVLGELVHGDAVADPVAAPSG